MTSLWRESFRCGARRNIRLHPPVYALHHLRSHHLAYGKAIHNEKPLTLHLTLGTQRWELVHICLNLFKGPAPLESLHSTEAVSMDKVGAA